MAEGDLEQTPYAHLVVYLLDRRLTGELFLAESEEVTHAVRFERGVPTKIRMEDGYARLGDLLVEEGLVTAEAIEGAVATGGLLGDVLVLAGRVESEALNAVLAEQFRLRSLRLFDLPPQTTYKYFDQSDTLCDYGGESAVVQPLELLWQGIRAHGERSAYFEPTLDRLGAVPLKLHPRETTCKFGFEDDAQLVIEVLGLEPALLAELQDLDGASADIVNKVVYTLAIGRQLELGRGALPVGVDPRPSSLAKVQLKSQVHRVGVALDAPGDGERSVRTLSVRGRAVIPRDDDEAALECAPPPEAVPAENAEENAVSVDSSALVDEPTLQSNEAHVEPPTPVEQAVAEDDDVGSAEDSSEMTPAEESSRRLVADTLRAMPVDSLMKLAREKIDAKEATMASEVCEVALKKLSDAGETTDARFAEVLTLGVWARAVDPHPDLKALAFELDDLIRERDDLALPRFVRGSLRKRLGNEAGAISDFRRVLEIDPSHDAAQNEARGLEPRTVKRGETGFLKRLFRR